LVQAPDGNLYGTTAAGATNDAGTVFEITPKGALTTLYSFCSLGGSSCTDGFFPDAALIQGTDGNFYGATLAGGVHLSKSSNLGGTVFRITPSGTLTTLYNFCSAKHCWDGQQPQAALVQDTDGMFYGTTFYGDTDGEVFSLSVSLGSFVKVLPASGRPGRWVEILGQGIIGTSDVRFNGTPTIFQVSSHSHLKAKVPNGVTTGFVTVTTPGGMLTSNQIFRVKPQILSFTPPSGPEGTSVTITGNGLTQATKVNFGSAKPTAFTVDSDTQVTATVTPGAKTGLIEITTSGGKAFGRGIFTVTP